MLIAVVQGRSSVLCPNPNSRGSFLEQTSQVSNEFTNYCGQLFPKIRSEKDFLNISLIKLKNLHFTIFSTLIHNCSSIPTTFFICICLLVYHSIVNQVLTSFPIPRKNVPSNILQRNMYSKYIFFCKKCNR
jgi:hypothetical protein